MKALATGSWLNLERIYLVAGVVGFGSICLIGWLYMTSTGTVDILKRPLGTDFSNVWTAGMMALDEPAAGLAPDEINELIRHLRELRDRDGLTIVLVEHIMELVMGVCDRITVLSFGEVLAEGPPEQIRTDARVIDAYLGKPAV